MSFSSVTMTIGLFTPPLCHIVTLKRTNHIYWPIPKIRRKSVYLAIFIFWRFWRFWRNRRHWNAHLNKIRRKSVYLAIFIFWRFWRFWRNRRHWNAHLNKIRRKSVYLANHIFWRFWRYRQHLQSSNYVRTVAKIKNYFKSKFDPLNLTWCLVNW